MSEVERIKQAISEADLIGAKVSGWLSDSLSKAQDYDVVAQTLQEVGHKRDELQLANETLAQALAEANSKIAWYQPKLRETHAELAEVKGEVLRLSEILERYNTRGREAFKVDPDFNPATDLSADELALYKQAWAELEDEWGTYIEPLSRGCKPGRKGNKELIGAGGMDLQNMRNVGHVNSMLMVLLHQLGDPAALKRLQQLWQIVLNPQIMATAWGPLNTKARTRTVNGVRIDLEQVGVPRFNYEGTDSGTTTAGAWDNDLHELDQDLSTGTVAEAAFVFKVNGCDAELALTMDYCEALVKRITRIGEVYEPGMPWFVQGKSLRHPAVSRRSFHYFMYLITGSDVHKTAYEWYARHLAADEDYLDLPVGEGVFVPHFTVSLIKERGDSESQPGLQDITYLREDIPHEVFALWVGAPFMSKRFVAARARSVLSVALFEGPLGSRISASTGGYGNLERRGQYGVSVNGEWTVGRWKNGRLGDIEQVFQISRSFPTLGAVYASDQPEYLQILKDFDKRPDSIQHRRYGSRGDVPEQVTAAP